MSSLLCARRFGRIRLAVLAACNLKQPGVQSLEWRSVAAWLPYPISIASLSLISRARGAEGKQPSSTRLQSFATISKTSGFLYLSGHGVPEESVLAVREQSRRFHALPIEEKLKLELDRNFRGYIPINTSTIVTSSVAKVSKPNQSKSLMIMHEVPPDDPAARAGKPLQGPNQWPPENLVPGFRAAVERYVSELTGLAHTLIGLIAAALNVPRDELMTHFAKPTTFLRLLRYPPQRQEDGLFGSAPHTDYGFITLLAQDEVGGLRGSQQGGGVDRRAADSRHVRHERRGHSRPLVERSLRIHAASRHQSFGSRTIFAALLFRSVDGLADCRLSLLRRGERPTQICARRLWRLSDGAHRQELPLPRDVARRLTSCGRTRSSAPRRDEGAGLSRFSPFKDTLWFAPAVPAPPTTGWMAASLRTSASFAAASRSLTAARRSAYVGSTSMTLSAQGVGQFGSAREFSNGGVSAAPVGVVI